MNNDDVQEVFDKLVSEMNTAQERYGSFASSHEGYGVLMEEVDELIEAIRCNDLFAIDREALQVAAVALRIVLCCREPKFRGRSVKK